MLMPFVSVTVIGLIGGAFVARSRRLDPGGPVGLGVLGAWLGFIGGAIVGVTIDVVAHTGIYVAVLGHLGALAGTALILRSGGRSVRTAR